MERSVDKKSDNGEASSIDAKVEDQEAVSSKENERELTFVSLPAGPEMIQVEEPTILSNENEENQKKKEAHNNKVAPTAIDLQAASTSVIGPLPAGPEILSFEEPQNEDMARVKEEKISAFSSLPDGPEIIRVEEPQSSSNLSNEETHDIVEPTAAITQQPERDELEIITQVEEHQFLSNDLSLDRLEMGSANEPPPPPPPPAAAAAENGNSHTQATPGAVHVPGIGGRLHETHLNSGTDSFDEEGMLIQAELVQETSFVEAVPMPNKRVTKRNIAIILCTLIIVAGLTTALVVTNSNPSTQETTTTSSEQALGKFSSTAPTVAITPNMIPSTSPTPSISVSSSAVPSKMVSLTPSVSVIPSATPGSTPSVSVIPSAMPSSAPSSYKIPSFFMTVFYPTPTPDICYLPPRTGNCLAALFVWYYDDQKDSCEEFVWGGCGGNENRFWTKSDCEDTCMLI